FFFSSRRRHTRSTRDWSSDVCSSDLAVVVDAEVTVSDEVNNHSFTTRTDQQGRYKVEGLSAGIYTLVVSAKGFSEGRKEAVKVEEGVVVKVDLRLEVASVEANVTVPTGELKANSDPVYQQLRQQAKTDQDFSGPYATINN